MMNSHRIWSEGRIFHDSDRDLLVGRGRSMRTIWSMWRARLGVMPWLPVAVLSLCLPGSWTWAGCSKGGKTSKGHKGKTGVTKVAVKDWPKAKVVWRQAHAGRLRPLASIGKVGIVEVSTRGRVPRGLYALDLGSGKKMWEAPALIAPALVRRGVPWGLSWAVDQVGAKTVFAYQRRRDRVTALDAQTGTRLWTVVSRHGVARVSGKMAVSDGQGLELLDPVSGTRTRSMDLTQVALGAGHGGVRTGLKSKTVLDGIEGKILVTRRDGGELQMIDPKAGRLAWRFFVKNELGRHVMHLPWVDRVLLVPTGYADPQRITVLVAWKSAGQAGSDVGRPAWKAALEGKTLRRWIWPDGTHLVVLTTDAGKRRWLVTLDRNTGKQLSMVQVPSVRECSRMTGGLVCRSGGQVMALAYANGALSWQQSVGSRRDRLRTVQAAGSHVVAVTGSKIWVLDAATGKATWRMPKLLDGVRISVKAVVGEAQGRIVLVVRTHQPQPNLDRFYLIGLDPAGRSIVWKLRLGKPSPDRRAKRAGAGEVDLKVPVVLGGTKSKRLVFSAVGKNIRLIRPTDGKILREFGQPGRPDRRTALFSVSGQTALLERGNLLMAVALSDARILWRRAVKNQDVTHFGSGQVFLVDAAGKVTYGAGPGSKLAKPVAGALAKNQGPVAFADARRLMVRTDRNLLVLDRAAGTVLAKLRRTSTLFSLDDQMVIGIQHRYKPAEYVGSYIGLDRSTGKVLWRKDVHRKETGGLPSPVLRERRWPVAWVRAAGRFFVTTDEVGQCVVAIAAKDGKSPWTVCFDRLVGTPVVASGYLFVAATGEPHGEGQAASSVRQVPGSRRKGSRLFAIRLSDGTARVIMAPGQGKGLELGSFQPTTDGLVLVTEAPLKLGYRDNEVVALRLW